MHKLIRFFNQNRKKVWMGILIIVAVIALIQILNYFAKVSADKKKEENIDSGNTAIYNPNESIIGNKDVSENKAKEFNQTIETFLDYGMNQDFQKAYEMLSKECKEVLYPTLDYFEQTYYSTVFSPGKTYNYKSWISEVDYIYLVRIADNPLATGKASNIEAVEDYYTVVKEGEKYKLNINGYIGRKKIEEEQEKDGIKLKIDTSDVFMDYEIYNVIAYNNTDKTILLDGQTDTESMYVTNNTKIKFGALSHELVEEDLKVLSRKLLKTKIKFNDNYRNSRKIEKITFSNIIKDYDSYQSMGNNKTQYKDSAAIEIGLN